MSRDLYLKHYRLREKGGVLPAPVVESGPATTFKAADIRTGAPVLLTLIPVGAIPDEQREKFEEKGRGIVEFDHAHLARTVDFGQEDDEYAFVSEYPRGSTTEEWVSEHGSMPPEAVLRIALQVVNFVGAAVYRQIVHEGIRPGNIVITPDQIAEGGWPSIKLVNLATGGVGLGGTGSPDSINFASPETLKDGVSDFRSEIYSLGATMCFLLTGAFDSAEPMSLQTGRLAGPLRKLIQPMLRPNPEERPQDLEAVTENLRAALQTVERRQLLARRVGIPFLAVRSRSGRVKELPPLPKQILAPIGGEIVHENDREEEPSIPVARRWSPAFAIAAALLLGLGVIGAAVIPARHYFFAHENNSGEIGVPIGVSQPAPVWDGKPLVMNKDRIPTAPVSQASAAPSATDSSTSVAAGQPAAEVSAPSPTPPAVAQADQSEPPAPAQGPQSVWEKAGNRPLSERIVTKDGIASASSVEIPDDGKKTESSQESQPPAGNPIASNDRSESPQPRLRPGSSLSGRKTSRPMTGHGSVARIAADGSVILRLPNGETAVLPPPKDEYPVRRYHRPRRYPYYPPD